MPSPCHREATYDYRTRRLSKTEYDLAGVPTSDTLFRYDGGVGETERHHHGDDKAQDRYRL